MEIKVVASSSKGNCYIVDDGASKLIIECGIPWLQILDALNYKTADVCGCLISHSHGDHSKAITEVMRNGIEVYTSAECLEELGDKINAHHRANRISDYEFTVGSYKVRPFAVEHDVTNLAFLIKSTVTNETLLFVTDTNQIPYAVNGLDYLICECNFDRKTLFANIDSGLVDEKLALRIIKNHMEFETIKTYIEHIDRRNLKQIYLIHLSNQNINQSYVVKEIQKLTGCEVII